MMLPSSLLTSIFILATSATAAPAADDGQWRPDSYGGAAVVQSTALAAASPTVQTKPLDTTGPTPSLVMASSKNVAASGTLAQPATLTAASWESEVTWPAGCEEWANPCPPGAKISGGGVAGYTNGFTSYLTETDSNGVITGMPTKATIAAGVTEAASTLLTSARAASNSTFSSRGPSSTRSGFSSGQTEPAQQSTNGAGALDFATSSLVVVAAAMAMLL